MSSGRLLLSLFSYVKANDALLPDLWTPSQFEELQLQSLSALCTIAPLCINDYMTCQGNNRLLLLLDWCVGQGQLKLRSTLFVRMYRPWSLIVTIIFRFLAFFQFAKNSRSLIEVRSL